MFDTRPYEEKMQTTLEHFGEDLKTIRTGRAHPSMLDSVVVEAYGQKMPINQLGNVVAADAQLLQVTPFDAGNLQAITSAIRENQALGLNPSDDGRVVRVPVPSLTTERRQELVKQLHDKVEDCRIALRNIRQNGMKDAKAMKDNKEISEDELARIEKTIQKAVDDVQAKVDSTAQDKEQEILKV